MDHCAAVKRTFKKLRSDNFKWAEPNSSYVIFVLFEWCVIAYNKNYTSYISYYFKKLT